MNIELTEVAGKFIITDRKDDRRPDGVLPIYLGSVPHYLAAHLDRAQGRSLDLCTGSGFLAIFLADYCKSVVAADLSQRALEFAALNCRLNGVADRIELRQGDMWEVVGQNEKFDFITANPPFVPCPSEIKGALHSVGGEDGLSLTRKVLSGLKKHLAKNGIVQIYSLSLVYLDGHLLLEDEVQKAFSVTQAKASYLHFYSQPLPLEDYLAEFPDSPEVKFWKQRLRDKYIGLQAVLLTLERGQKGSEHFQVAKKERSIFPDLWGKGRPDLNWQNRFTNWLNLDRSKL